MQVGQRRVGRGGAGLDGNTTPAAHPTTTAADGAICPSAHRHTASDAAEGAREPETPTVPAEATRDESSDADMTEWGQKDRPGAFLLHWREPEAARKGPRGATRTRAPPTVGGWARGAWRARSAATLVGRRRRPILKQPLAPPCLPSGARAASHFVAEARARCRGVR